MRAFNLIIVLAAVVAGCDKYTVTDLERDRDECEQVCRDACLEDVDVCRSRSDKPEDDEIDGDAYTWSEYCDVADWISNWDCLADARLNMLVCYTDC